MRGSPQIVPGSEQLESNNDRYPLLSQDVVANAPPPVKPAVMRLNEGDIMPYKLEDDDYLKLWMYFQDRADNIKEAMFKTLTWIVGYAAALLGFIFLILTNYETTKAAVARPLIVALAAVAGLVICLYSWFALSESAKHIQRNWTHAIACGKQVDGLAAILRSGDNKNTMKIWDQLRIIVALFGLGFIAVLVWTLTCGASA
jgi:hypothetical protein